MFNNALLFNQQVNFFIMDNAISFNQQVNKLEH